MRLGYLLLIALVLLIQLECTNPILLTSAPNNLNQASQNMIGIVIALGVTAFYICGVVVLIMTVAFTSKEAKKDFLDLNEAKRRMARSLPADNDYLIDLALMLDTHYCMSKLLCEVEAEPEMERTSEERMLLAIFDRAPISSLKGFRLENRKNLEKAKHLGKESGDPEVCEKQYSSCPLMADHLFDMWKMALHLRRTFFSQFVEESSLT